MVSKFVKSIITLILMLITVDRRGKLTLGSILEDLLLELRKNLS